MQKSTEVINDAYAKKQGWERAKKRWLEKAHNEVRVERVNANRKKSPTSAVALQTPERVVMNVNATNIRKENECSKSRHGDTH